MMMILLAVVSRQLGIAARSSSRSINDWGIVELADQLNRIGVKVQLRSTQQNGTIGQRAFLTSTDKDWHSLNALKKDPNHIGAWRGVLYCERVGEGDATHLTNQWGYHCLAVGPFLFYGDADLLRQVRDALLAFAPSTAL
jgi:hypothetical protein